MAGATTKESLEAATARSVAELAESDGVRECLRWFGRQRRWIDQKHLELCRIPAPTFQEQERAEWMAAQFKALGHDAETDRAGNVIAGFQGVGRRPSVALTAHLDTVLAPRSAEEIIFDGDGTFRGPGVSDNGAGLAALLAVAGVIGNSTALAEFPTPLLLIANVGEEGEGDLSGMRYLCRQSGLGAMIRAFVVLDGPATDRITSRAVASRRFEVTMTGPGGHSWSDYGIANPVHALSKAIALFSEDGSNGAGAASSGVRSSFNFGTIEGGTSINSIPAVARAKVDLRSESPGRIDEMTRLLSASVERALEAENGRSSGPKLAAKIRQIGSRPGGSLAEDAPVLAYLRAVDAYLGIRSQLDCGSTDANIPLSIGRQALSIGAGGQGGGVHTPSEWFHSEGREIGLRRILLTLCLLMRDPRTAVPVTDS